MFTSFYYPIHKSYIFGSHCKKNIDSANSAAYRQTEIDRDINYMLFIRKAHIILTLRSLMARKPALSF